MRECADTDTLCYDLRVSYADNSTVRQMECGAEAVSCEVFARIAGFQECYLSRCRPEGDDCETEMISGAGRVALTDAWKVALTLGALLGCIRLVVA